MNKNGSLVVVSGFSGAGKGTLMKELVSRYDQYALSVSATTRKPREGELHGREYFFITTDEFETMIKENNLIEYAKYVNNYYGTPKDYVISKMNEGKDVILEIEIQGALKIKERFPDAILLFIMPPSAAELKKRLIGRGTETEEVINARLKRAVEESQGIEKYDYILINDEINACVEKMHELIQCQHLRSSVNLDFITNIRKELSNL